MIKRDALLPSKGRQSSQDEEAKETHISFPEVSIQTLTKHREGLHHSLGIAVSLCHVWSCNEVAREKV